MFLAQKAWASEHKEVNIKALKVHNISLGLIIQSPYNSIEQLQDANFEEFKGTFYKEVTRGSFFIEYSQEI